MRIFVYKDSDFVQSETRNLILNGDRLVEVTMENVAVQQLVVIFLYSTGSIIVSINYKVAKITLT